MAVGSWFVIETRRRKKTAGGEPGGFWRFVARCFAYALASPAAERCENQKYAKKCGQRESMAQCSMLAERRARHAASIRRMETPT